MIKTSISVTIEGTPDLDKLCKLVSLGLNHLPETDTPWQDKEVIKKFGEELLRRIQPDGGTK